MYTRHPVQLDGGKISKEESSQIKKYVDSLVGQIEDDVAVNPKTAPLRLQYGLPRNVKSQINAYANEILKGPHYNLTQALRKQDMAASKLRSNLEVRNKYQSPLQKLVVDNSDIYKTAFLPEISKIDKIYSAQKKQKTTRTRRTKAALTELDQYLAEKRAMAPKIKAEKKAVRDAIKAQKALEAEALSILGAFDLSEAMALAQERPKRKAKNVERRSRTKASALEAIKNVTEFPHLYPAGYLETLTKRYAKYL